MSLFVPMQHSDEELSLSQEIVQLSDNFSEFNKVNAFLCVAFTSVMSSDDPVQENVLQGAKYCSDYLQVRSRELKEAIDQLRERCAAEGSKC